MLALVFVLAAAPCALSDKKAALAAGDFAGVDYQPACASVGAAFLASDDATERAAAAEYGYRFRPAGKKTVNVPFVSDFVGPITLVHYQHYFSLTKAQRAAILAHAPAETNPLVVIEQLRHFGALAGTDASLALLRAAPLVASDPKVRADALAFWKFVPPKKLRVAEIEAAWRFDQPPDVSVTKVNIDRSPERLAAAKQRLGTLRPGEDPSSAFRAVSEAGGGDAISSEVIANARAFIDEKKGDCFFLTPKLEAASGHLPTLLALAEAVQQCTSAFTVMGPLTDGLARTPDPEQAVLAALPHFAKIPKGSCRVITELIGALPLDAKPSTYVALAEAFDVTEGDSCLWTAAEPLGHRLALTTATPEGIAAVLAIGKRLVARGELWRHGDRLVYALVRGRNDAAADAIAALAALESKKSTSLQWAANAEAAMYVLGGPKAEQRAAAMRRYMR